MKPAGLLFAALIVQTLPAHGQPATGPVPSHQARGQQELRQCLSRAGDPFSDDRCYNREVGRQEVRLARALVAARAYLVRAEREARGAMQDSRRDPVHLDRSQAAWRTFVDRDCTVRAGLLGGANIWVTRAFRTCYLEELDRRSSFLESIASGEFTAA